MNNGEKRLLIEILCAHRQRTPGDYADHLIAACIELLGIPPEGIKERLIEKGYSMPLDGWAFPDHYFPETRKAGILGIPELKRRVG